MQWYSKNREYQSLEINQNAVLLLILKIFSYLHQNSIEKIEGLEELTKLVTLNLSHNRIKKVEGLSGLPLLKNLDLSHNIISDI